MSKVATSRGSRVEEVRLGLLTDLTSGALPVGAKLVNEIELATRFTVSRLTVREAVSALVTAGYLERRHGSGTYVVGLPGPRHALDATLSYTRMIAGRVSNKMDARIIMAFGVCLLGGYGISSFLRARKISRS